MIDQADKKPAVCFFGYSEPEEGGRSWMIRTGLAENGITIQSCRTDAEGFIKKYRELYRMGKDKAASVNAIYVVFMGYYLMPLAWYLARRRGIPVILDALVSQYETEVIDRKRVSQYNPRAWFLWCVDFISCFFADAVVVDTREHEKYFITHFRVSPSKIIVVPVGCRSDLFIPIPKPKEAGDFFVVEFHGGFSPLQGIEHIIEAAKILQDRRENIRFEITGSGQTHVEIQRIAKNFGLNNVEFRGRVHMKELPHVVARGDICLGIFGTSEKALSVVPHKVYECLSCGKPVITERSPAALELLHDRKEVIMVEPGSGADLAEKILELKRDTALRAELGEHAREISLGIFSPRSIVKNLVDWLQLHS